MPTLQGRRHILGEVQSSTGCASYDDWEVDEVLHKNTLYKEIFISKLGNLTYRHPNTDHPNFTFYKKGTATFRNGRLTACSLPTTKANPWTP